MGYVYKGCLVYMEGDIKTRSYEEKQVGVSNRGDGIKDNFFAKKRTSLGLRILMSCVPFVRQT